MKNTNHYAILMAGGIGSRFWPVSTSKYPKQFQDILGAGSTLIQTTFHRLAKLMPVENIIILTHKDYKETVKEQLPQVNDEQIVLEPEMRNTAPSILLGALKIKKKNKDALILVAPSDHWIQGDVAFQDNIEEAFKIVASEDKLITLGIEPTFPNTGYGYIKYEKDDAEGDKHVLRFTEKPSFKQAESFLEEGNYVWNAGIFIWSAAFILESFKKYHPETFRLFQKGNDVYNTEKEQEFLDENYHKTQSVSIDYAIMEKSDSVYVIPAKFKWNDLGTWKSLEDELPQDDQHNTMVNGRLLPLNSTGNIIKTHSNKVVVLDGLHDFVVVENDKILLITPKDNIQEIKAIREKVMAQFGEDLG
ncbi:mannose-1-phosphate guanylyltransferase [Salegentibacter holothuriorum]|uniref:mannose-1-phosphate guanylyltransferase n=1 Tax=Salegentibacter holothuriorum TaxID=241145 RepID=A0A1T5E153_9FLAO|nr:mannose-1-phosphate guanylyltransferase [Salegentibacter holothuriorum]SKB77665.1 mannose-1-phosphate guanylyltransferase [Salegentibacter holothuriorum]